jgi:Na(+)-translocating NADH:ubiquinone oxidoreductase C subunit
MGIGVIGCNSVVSTLDSPESQKRMQRSSLHKDLSSLLCSNVDSLNQLFYLKKINSEGALTSCRSEEFYHLVRNVQRNNEEDDYPILELKNTNKAILFCGGTGLWDAIWGMALVNRSNGEIINALFDHAAETPGLGSNITKQDWSDQFIGTSFNQDSVNFSLNQSHDSTSIKHHIDGVSGATFTGKGAIEMLNEARKKYEGYFE